MAGRREISMNIEKALTIPGWMSPAELEWLAEAASRSTCIAEVGVWRGRTTVAMAENTKGVIYSVDPWGDEFIGNPGPWTDGEWRSGKYRQKDWLWWEFCANTRGYPNVIPLREFSSSAACGFRKEGKTFDMIWIDADHTFKSVVQDIKLWRPLLRPGGIFCGHDYGEPTCPEVKPAVDSLLKVEVVVGTIWREIA
jgi:hypothetical protein